MPNENNKVLKHNPGEIFVKAPFIIYSDLEPLLKKKMITCHNNPKVINNQHSASGYPLFIHCSFDATKN